MKGPISLGQRNMLTTVIDYCQIIQIKTQVQRVLNLKTEVQQLNFKTEVQQLNFKIEVQQLNFIFLPLNLRFLPLNFTFLV